MRRCIIILFFQDKKKKSPLGSIFDQKCERKKIVCLGNVTTNRVFASAEQTRIMADIPNALR